MSGLLRPSFPVRRGLDPKSVNRALFGAWYEEDIYDRFCSAVPAAMRAFWWRVPAAIRARELIFVHVPRVAGTSITRALYGEGCTRHHSIRYYRAVDPGLYERAASFAVLRDPFDRFASAYAFVRTGGTPDCRLSDAFVRATANVTTVEDYLCFLEGRGPLDLDFVMRPQSWFVCDLKTGQPLVKNLFLYGEDNAALARYLAPYQAGPLLWLNRARRGAMMLTQSQRARVEKLYAADFALVAALRGRRGSESVPGGSTDGLLHAAWIAAE